MNRWLPGVLLLFSGAVSAGQCEENFGKDGNAFKGTRFFSRVSVPQLSAPHALGQMRGILLAEKMQVITEDSEGGTLLAEQPATGTTRAIPTIVTVTEEGGDARVELAVKTDKGVFAKQENIKSYMCELLERLKGGAAGKAAGASGAQAQNNLAAAGKKDAFLFSMEIANEAKANVVALNARHRGRQYTLSGRIDYIQEDGENYNVSFDIPEMRERALGPLPGQANFRVGVACLFRPNQLATVLTLREKQSVVFTGTFLRYDDFKKMAWLENCKQVR